MKEEMNQSKRKRSFKKYLLWIIAGFFVVILTVGLFLYNNFNRILSDALLKSFNSSIISDVYELKFKNLNVNLFEGNIKVKNVEISPREKPLKDYPYINSSFRLTTKKILLTKVDLVSLLKQNKLKLEKIEIDEPYLEFIIADVVPIFVPFNDSTVVSEPEKKETKRSIEGFSLKEFKLINASFHVANSAKGRDLGVKNVNITLSNMSYDQQPGKDLVSYGHISFMIGEITGGLQRDRIKYIGLKDFKLTIDSLKIQRTSDTLIYRFNDYSFGLNDLNLQTEDSIFHLTVQSFLLSYKDKSINLKNLSFKPNISDLELQKRFKYQNTQFSGNIGALSITGINFDSLMFKKKLFIDDISIDSVSASLFKDKIKPLDVNKFPEYLGQTIKKMSFPIFIKQVKASNVNLVYNERKLDSTFVKVDVNRGIASVKNITNLPGELVLSMNVSAYLANKVHFNLSLGFNYLHPQFTIDGSFEKFNFTDLNPIIEAFAPAKINQGIVDEISFSGLAKRTDATGTMKFLYHELEVDLNLKNKANWKNSVLSFAANTIVASANPGSVNLPPRIVQFKVERDMNKSFINIILKSALNGIKETVVMSKENKKAYKEEKKRARKESKK